MSKTKKKSLFDDNEAADDDGDVTLKINDDYASKYDNWRKLEEKQKLLARYGEVAVTKSERRRLQNRTDEDGLDETDSESTSEEEDDDAEYDTPEVDKGFLRALSALKSKDPRIYDKSVHFTALREEEEDEEGHGRERKKNKKEKPMFLRDYDRHIILEKGGRYSDEEEESDTETRKPLVDENDRTYVQEQQELKESFKNLVQESDDEEEDDGFLKVRRKTKGEKEQEDADYRKWLKEAARDDIVLEDEDLAKDLSGLRNVWADNSLSEDEKFLKDYLLNQRYKEKDDEEFPTYDEIVEDEADLSEDEEIIEKQEEFEQKYNFRFEEPDADFIKSYPRTLKDTVRKPDTRRREKREDRKTRKEREKEEKRQELERLKELKREEIMERLKKIKEVSGNDRLALEDKDLVDDFDPEEHDRRMASLYGEDYYGGEDEGVDGEGKPVFAFDEEIDGDMPDWDNWDPSQEAGEDEEEVGSGERSKKKKKKKAKEEVVDSQEDDGNFVMDCDYDPTSDSYEAAMNANKKKGKKKKKSAFAKAVQRQKPVFDPVEKEFEEYFDEYYQLDFEDLVGDIPTRFKYRKVVPNDFGLTTDEILAAKDKELNRWVSLKKALQYRREEDERYDVQAYKKRAENSQLKMKLLPSVYNPSEEEQQSGESKKKKRKKKKKGRQNGEAGGSASQDVSEAAEKKNQEPGPFTIPARPSPNKGKKKRKFSESEDASGVGSEPQNDGQKKKFKPHDKASTVNNQQNGPKKRFEESAGPKISDERLKAFGLNPKKIRNKWKYGGKQKSSN